MAAPPWTGDDDTELRRLHAGGRSLHSIAKTMGRSKATIHRRAAALGLSWDRTATAAAATAVAVDNKARRVAIVARVYGQVEAELDRLDAGASGTGWRTILKGAFGVEEAQQLEFVPPRDRRDAADIINRHITSAAKLEALDAGAGVERERSLLSQLGEALGVTGPGA